jgi:preprotein translocase subunit SecG
MINREMDSTLNEAKNNKKFLTKRDALLIATLAITCAFLTIFARLMILARFSTYESNLVFQAYHPLTPWIYIFIATMFMVACYAKGVRYWLVYVTPVATMIYCIILLALINSWMHPSSLQTVVGWLAQFEWITGV